MVKERPRKGFDDVITSFSNEHGVYTKLGILQSTITVPFVRVAPPHICKGMLLEVCMVPRIRESLLEKQPSPLHSCVQTCIVLHI